MILKREWWLQSDPQQRGWGPFDSEAAAWRYLFGRKPEEQEIDRHKESGWYVGFIDKWAREQGT